MTNSSLGYEPVPPPSPHGYEPPPPPPKKDRSIFGLTVTQTVVAVLALLLASITFYYEVVPKMKGGKGEPRKEDSKPLEPSPSPTQTPPLLTSSPTPTPTPTPHPVPSPSGPPKDQSHAPKSPSGSSDGKSFADWLEGFFQNNNTSSDSSVPDQPEQNSDLAPYPRFIEEVTVTPEATVTPETVVIPTIKATPRWKPRPVDLPASFSHLRGRSLSVRVKVRSDGRAEVLSIQYPYNSHGFLRERAKEIVNEMQWSVARDDLGHPVVDDNVQIEIPLR